MDDIAVGMGCHMFPSVCNFVIFCILLRHKVCFSSMSCKNMCSKLYSKEPETKSQKLKGLENSGAQFQKERERSTKSNKIKFRTVN